MATGRVGSRSRDLRGSGRGEGGGADARGSGSDLGARRNAAQQVVDCGAQHVVVEGFGEHGHGAGLDVEVLRWRGAFAGQEQEARAQLGGARTRHAVEGAPVEVGEVEFAEDEIEGGRRGEPGEGERAVARDSNFVGVKRAGEAVQEMPRVVDDEDPWRAHGWGRSIHGEERTPSGRCSGGDFEAEAIRDAAVRQDREALQLERRGRAGSGEAGLIQGARASWLACYAQLSPVLHSPL